MLFASKVPLTINVSSCVSFVLSLTFDYHARGFKDYYEVDVQVGQASTLFTYQKSVPGNRDRALAVSPPLGVRHQQFNQFLDHQTSFLYPRDIRVALPLPTDVRDTMEMAFIFQCLSNGFPYRVNRLGNVSSKHAVVRGVEVDNSPKCYAFTHRCLSR
ncbi:hypothetical protein F4679DRAFT_363179 [Xylaria curta]|nr:hypothetical protein F4679DRAFT_363179 [Xylaria curta]